MAATRRAATTAAILQERRCTMLDFVNRLYARLTVRAEEEGQGMVEYGLIIALVAIVVIAALVILGPKIAEIFNKASASL
jgi:pilus assembly protein Flp/PilA